jgi:hypothetical protein
VEEECCLVAALGGSCYSSAQIAYSRAGTLLFRFGVKLQLLGVKFKTA